MIPEDKNLPEEDQGVVVTEPVHNCHHQEDWGKAKTTLDDHERRITKAEKEQENQKETISLLDRRTYETYGNIMTEISNLKENFNNQMFNLREGLGLTTEHNNTQDEKIKGIQEKEKQKLLDKGRRRGILIGAIVGAAAGGFATFCVMVAYRVIEIITFL
jgi:hypothetical protein